MWAISDSVIPRSYRMMEGFSIDIFRVINEEGKSCFLLEANNGSSSLFWDEAQILTGRNFDFHCKDFW